MAAVRGDPFPSRKAQGNAFAGRQRPHQTRANTANDERRPTTRSDRGRQAVVHFFATPPQRRQKARFPLRTSRFVATMLSDDTRARASADDSTASTRTWRRHRSRSTQRGSALFEPKAPACRNAVLACLRLLFAPSKGQRERCRQRRSSDGNTMWRHAVSHGQCGDACPFVATSAPPEGPSEFSPYRRRSNRPVRDRRAPRPALRGRVLGTDCIFTGSYLGPRVPAGPEIHRTEPPGIDGPDFAQAPPPPPPEARCKHAPPHDPAHVLTADDR
jgi:hypothetical protein